MSLKQWPGSAVLAAVTLLGGSVAFAQQASAPKAETSAQQESAIMGEIVVTARKRVETLISVPVAITAVSGEVLENRGVAAIDALARMVPGLVVGEGGGTVQGGNIALRGISGADASPFADQAVSFNVDGVQVARASVRRMSSMDMQQIEVLKGPQALFYGKNSPGGVISIHTADPTDHYEGKLSGGYEFNAREARGEGYFSGPITDKLGFRVSGYTSNMEGWVDNTAPKGTPYTPAHSSAPRADEYALRTTFKYKPSDTFDARFKFTYNHLDGDASTGNLQLVNCPTGAPQTGASDPCTGDDQVSVGYLGPNFANRDSRFGDGHTFLDQNQMLGGLEMNWQLPGSLTLTSVTGYYKVNLTNLGNFTATYVPQRMLPALNVMSIREVSEELRLASNYTGPINFMFGAHYQDSHAKTGSTTMLNGAAVLPTMVNNYLLAQDGQAYSVFAQAQWKFAEHFELSAGGRYSKEDKKLPEVRSGIVLDPATGRLAYPPPLVTTGKVKDSWNDFSPEATLSWRPSQVLTVYGSYKHGFISGGFNSGSANFTLPLDYNQETVKGFEAGVKASLFEGRLLANLDVFSYKVKGLQVQVTTQGTVQELKNVGSLNTKGVEFDLTYRASEGLTLHGAATYNRARYDEFFANCYRGQTQALGCSFVPVPGQLGQAVPVTTGNASLQNLAGTELARAPKFTGNVGLDFQSSLNGGKLKFGFGTEASYSDSMLTDYSSKEFARSPSYTLIDANIRVGSEDNRWEIALIGRNLTDKFYWTRNSDVPFSGTAPGNATGPSVLGDSEAAVSRGREVMLRLSTKF